MVKPFDDRAPAEISLNGKSVEDLLLLVGDEDQGCKPEAMDRILSMGLKANYPVLEKAVKNDFDADLRNGAMEVLVRFGKQAVPDLINLLQDENEEVRNFSAVMLGDISSRQAVGPLIEALRDRDINVRHAAAEALGKIGDHAALLPLIELLKEDFWLQYPAIVAMGEMRDNRAVPQLLQLLDDEMLREPVIEALGKIGDPRAILPLADILCDPLGNSVDAAARALAAIQRARGESGYARNNIGACTESKFLPCLVTEQGVANLKKMLGRENSMETHCASVMLLGLLREKSAIPDFFRLLEDGDYQTVVCDAITAIGKPAVPLLLDGLSHPHENVRIAALRSLRRMGSSVGISRLLRLLDGGPASVQHEVLKSLAGTTHGGVLEVLMPLLESASDAVRLQAIEVISHYPPNRIMPVLAGLLNSADPRERGGAAILIGHAGAEAFMEALSALFGDADAGVRREAACAAGWWRCREAIPLLLGALHDEDGNVREEAVMSLTGFAEAAPVAEILCLLGKGDERLDYAIIRGVGRTGAAEAEAPLVRYLATCGVSRHLEFAVIETLGKLGCKGGAGRRAVMDYLAHHDPDIRRLAVQALANLAGPDCLEELVLACRDPHWSVRVAALQELGKIGGAKVVPVLSAALSDQDCLVRKNAILSLGKSGCRLAVNELVMHLTDMEMGKYAAEALTTIGRAGLPRLHRIIRGRYPYELRERVIELVGRIGDAKSVSPLLDLLADPSAAMRLAAIDALVSCYDNNPLKKLAQVKRCDEDEEVKVKAAMALKSLTVEKCH